MSPSYGAPYRAKYSEIRNYYAIYHTFDIEEAAERMMNVVPDNPVDLRAEGVAILRRLYHESDSHERFQGLPPERKGKW